MPELPEVERFRQLLLPLVSNNGDDDDSPDAAAVHISVLAPHRGISIHSDGEGHDDDTKNVAAEQGGEGGGVRFPGGCAAVHRKGKQLCLEFRHRRNNNAQPRSSSCCCLCLHMGMTGSIRVRGVGENWGHNSGGDIKDTLASTGTTSEGADCWPPKFAYLSIIRRHSNSNNNDRTSSSCYYEAYFCDARKFGRAFFVDRPADVLDPLAPDALLLLPVLRRRKTTSDDDDVMTKEDDADDDDNADDIETMLMMIVPRLANQRVGVKALLLDQKRVVSGVGNWYVHFVYVVLLLLCVLRIDGLVCCFVGCFFTERIHHHMYVLLYIIGSPTKSCTKPGCIRNSPTYPATKRFCCCNDCDTYYESPSRRCVNPNPTIPLIGYSTTVGRNESRPAKNNRMV
jgi:Formamidopyrimidine-DNA glycosylase N-terminal domain